MTQTVKWVIGILLSLLLFAAGVFAAPFLDGVAKDAELEARVVDTEAEVMLLRTSQADFFAVHGQIHQNLAVELTEIKSILTTICKATPDAYCP
jgi:hypothetical protein